MSCTTVLLSTDPLPASSLVDRVGLLLIYAMKSSVLTSLRWGFAAPQRACFACYEKSKGATGAPAGPQDPYTQLGAFAHTPADEEEMLMQFYLRDAQWTFGRSLRTLPLPYTSLEAMRVARALTARSGHRPTCA